MTFSQFRQSTAICILSVSLGSVSSLAQNTNAKTTTDTPPVQGKVVEDIVARVNDQIITSSDYDRAAEQLTAEAGQQSIPPRELEQKKADLLRDLIDQQLLLSKGKELGITGETFGRGVQPGQQFGGRSSAAIGVLSHEAGQALLAQAACAVGGGIAGDEGQRDRAVDGGEDGGGAGPEAFEQATQLVGECDAMGHQVVAAADQSTQRFNVIGHGHQRTETVAVGAQDVGEHEGVARIGLAARRAIAGAGRLSPRWDGSE